MSDKSLVLLRISISIMFFWFGFHQLLDSVVWVSYLPNWTGYFPIPGEILVQANGWLEIVLAFCLLFGFAVRTISIFLAFHLLVIAVGIGGATGVRDAMIMISIIILAINEPDEWTVDYFLKSKK